jgi:recombination protein RecA
MSSKTAALRAHVESLLSERIPRPFQYSDRQAVETVSSGIAEIDSLTGGLPRGGLTEIFGAPGCGQTTLLMASLASRTMASEVCALVDAHDSFDPHAAEASGVNLKRVLWVRCRNIDHALRATDLLIHGGGFGLIALDLSDIAPRTVRQVPLNAWFRLRRAVENTPTILMAIEQESNAKTCASLVLRLDSQEIRWSQTNAEEYIRPPSWGCLLDSWTSSAEIARSRMKAEIFFRDEFQIQAIGDYCRKFLSPF